MKTKTEILELLSAKLPLIGTVAPRSTDEIEGSTWLLGCECLDRDYTDYDQYKEFLMPLGIKLLRFQGGWAKTEKEKGVYDWGWMDHIVNDAVSRGLRPWIQTGYGNTIYPGGGGDNLGAGMPLSDVAREAYEKWVAAMVQRYRDRVKDWEVWNEPNFGDNKVNTPEITADFNIRTARIIKSIQPEANISALSLGHIDVDYVERFFRYLHAHDACGLFRDVTYHDYVYNPDSNKLKVYQMRQIVEKYAPGMILRQGENGAPSEPYAGGALWNHDWTELSQAKWYLRRMLENLGNDIECSVFSIAEIQYDTRGPITKTNTKGLLKTNKNREVVRTKMAYHAVQHTTSVFDDTLERIAGATFRHNLYQEDGDRITYNSDRSISVFGYRNKENGDRVYTIWRDEAIPDNDCHLTEQEFGFAGSHFREPVLVDLVTGGVFSLGEGNWRRDGNIDRFRGIPVYDSPVLIAEKALIKMNTTI